MERRGRGRKSALLNLMIGRSGETEGVESSEEQGARLLAHHQDTKRRPTLSSHKEVQELGHGQLKRTRNVAGGHVECLGKGEVTRV